MGLLILGRKTKKIGQVIDESMLCETHLLDYYCACNSFELKIIGPILDDRLKEKNPETLKG